MSTHALDNPVWNALLTSQADFAEGNDLARRYAPQVAQFCAIPHASPLAFKALERLLGPGGVAVFFTSQIESWPEGWKRMFTASVSQMVCENLNAAPEILADTLTALDVPAMLELTHLTQPGPFKERTVELGTYLGLHDADRLVAMAGERLRMPGFTEISAVCTHPDHRGRGYALALVHRLARAILARNEIPFLHVLKDNAKAIELYRALGFVERREVSVLVLKTPS